MLHIILQILINSGLDINQLISNVSDGDTHYITRISPGGILISEPVTALTDIVLSFVCLYCFLRLRKTRSDIPTVKLFSYYFLTLSIATAYGGIVGHAFIHLLSYEWKMPAWFISMISVALFERAAIIHAYPLLRKNTGRFFAILNIVELLTLLTIVSFTRNFFYVELHAAYGLLVIVFSFELYVYRKTGEKGSRIVLYAIGVSALAALVHLTRIAPHIWFNHLDLSHVLMTVAAGLYYIGCTLIIKSKKQTADLKAHKEGLLN